MNVAKTYKEWEKVGEIYILNNKQYIKAKHPNTGNLRQIRVYSDAEYKRMYPDEKIVEKKDSNAPRFKNQKNVLGFEKGFITIFKGDTYAHLEWFQQSEARYCRWWGWYFISTAVIPEDLPEGIIPIQLNWELVGKDNGDLKTDEQVASAIDSLIYEESPSQFIGNIGERIEVDVTVIRAIELDGRFGKSTIHIMEDKDKNVYVWTTASKTWNVDSVKKIRGTVKDHRVYKNTKQTLLIRCMEVK